MHIEKTRTSKLFFHQIDKRVTSKFKQTIHRIAKTINPITYCQKTSCLFSVTKIGYRRLPNSPDISQESSKLIPSKLKKTQTAVEKVTSNFCWINAIRSKGCIKRKE